MRERLFPWSLLFLLGGAGALLPGREVPAEDDAAGASPRGAGGGAPIELGLAAEEGSSGLYLRRPPARNYYETPEFRSHRRSRHYGLYSPHYVPPWAWYAPQTHQYKKYPPPVALEPRLGLMYNYPYAYQMGLQMPADADPLYTYSLGPFRGVVRSPMYPAWLDPETGQQKPSADRWGVRLMREGKFQAAGRLQARGFRHSDDPRYPLLLAESLFGLGKPRHAEMVLRHALAQDGVFDLIPEDVASHFASVEDFEKRVQALVATGKHPLLSAYLRLFTRDGSAGLDALAQLMEDHSDDEAYARLYRHFLGKAFGRREKTKPPVAPEKPKA